MKRKQKSWIAAVLCMALCLSCVLPAGAWEAHTSSAGSNNLGNNDYRNAKRNARLINSYLVPNADGTLTRVEYTGEKVVVETYSADFQFISGFSIDPELPLFGGFYAGQTHNFLVFGQENNAEDDSCEVIRVVCYTKDWQRVGSDGLFGANTTIPFHAGSLRFAECDGYLYIRTCHQMYTHTDGLRHQANVMLNFRIADTTITDSLTEIAYDGLGYVSHSFNQFVAVDGKDLLAVDHGDAYPRSVVLFKYVAPAGQDSFQDYKLVNMGEYWMAQYVDMVNVLQISGQVGANDTGVALGGFEVSDSAYLIAGNTVSQEPGCNLFGQRNIFISVTSKEDFSEAGTTVRYLTDYSDGDDVEVSNPHFVKISGDRFAVLWTEKTDAGNCLRYCLVDGLGRLQGQIHSADFALSDCKPAVVGNKLIWYITQNCAPAFLSIDLDHPEDTSHQHCYRYSYWLQPWYEEEGLLVSECMICGQEGPEVVIPSLDCRDAYTLVSVSEEPTCTQDGFGLYRWNDVEKYNLPYFYYYDYEIPKLGHDWVAGDCENGETCSRCGESQQATGHDWIAATCTAPETCAICGQTRGEAAGHSYQAEVTPPTATDSGYTTYTCTGCGDSYVANEVPALGYTLTGTVKSYLTDGEVTVELIRDGQLIDSRTLTGKSCEYAFRLPQAGEYTLRISKENHVPQELALTIRDPQTQKDVTLRLIGDITGDGAVNVKDFQRLLRHINKTNLLDQELLACGDITGDGNVNIKDFQRLLRHINKTNPLF